MANVDEAIDYSLGFEDSTLSGKITIDDGGRTRFGVAEKYHPELTASLFYGSMGRDAALVIARNVYHLKYADPLSIAEIADQDIANKLLSLGINMGVARVSKMLQDAVGVPEDGVIGVQTLLALSKSNSLQVLAELKSSAERYYRQVAADHSEDQEFLNGWIARARA